MAQQYKTNSQGHLILTLPRSGTVVHLRSPKGKDTKALQAAIDISPLSDYEVGMLLMERCIVRFGDQETITAEELDELDLADIQYLDKAMDFFRLSDG